ncbi:Aste57867_364 [Aphanomyces stellatus]|uniref:Aste57867_364 protein n=1 Tax=Aphanomyces stellatus TaxID=120398 RepID=A0A485K2L7_9STRA|nr:hypothetical protein As57867_000363 [Aphanomyces stellatus]VFT77589.1 Aste57867_364 [Aphanomyces stellatus]
MDFVSAPVSQDLTKVITATTAISAGHVIFVEAAVVASAADDDFDGRAALDAVVDASHVSAYVRTHFDALMTTCALFPALDSVNVRKNLFKCFRLIDADPNALRDVHQLPVNVFDVAATMAAAKGLLDAHPNVIPKVLDTRQVAHLIGVLNKNCLGLDHDTRTGLFYYFSKLRHNCNPTASHTIQGDVATLVATRDIATGEELTVELVETYYTCVDDRRETLSIDGQVCACAVCIGVAADRTRAFKCTAAGGGCTGIVHPTNNVFACTHCGLVWPDAVVAAAQTAEESLLIQLDVNDVMQFDHILATSSLHAYHYVFFNWMNDVVTSGTDGAFLTDDVGDPPIDLSDDEWLNLLYRMVNAINYVVPFPHAAKLPLYTSIAHLEIVLHGDMAKAHQAYAAARAICAKVYPPTSDVATTLAALTHQTPKTSDELAAVLLHTHDTWRACLPTSALLPLVE